MHRLLWVAAECIVQPVLSFLVTDHSFIFKKLLSKLISFSFGFFKVIIDFAQTFGLEPNTVFIVHRLWFSTWFLLFQNNCYVHSMCICCDTHTDTLPTQTHTLPLTTSEVLVFCFMHHFGVLHSQCWFISVYILVFLVSLMQSYFFLFSLPEETQSFLKIKLRKQSNELWLLSALRRIRV